MCIYKCFGRLGLSLYFLFFVCNAELTFSTLFKTTIGFDEIKIFHKFLAPQNMWLLERKGRELKAICFLHQPNLTQMR